MPMRVLSWNLYHGRDFPPDPALFTLRSRLLRVTERDATHVQVNRPLLDEFARWLDGLEWDVALLQEAPPRWFAELGRRTRVERRARAHVAQLVARAPAARREWNPDLIASGEGGSNQILVRRPGRIARAPPAHARRWRPEQRRMMWTRVELPAAGDVCVANLHASAGLPRSARRRGAGRGGSTRSSGRAATRSSSAATSTCARRATRSRSRSCASASASASRPPRSAIDHLLARGLEVVERPRRLRREERELTEPRRPADPAVRPRALSSAGFEVR